MHLAVTGGTGFVGSFIVAAALRAGHRVTLLSRRQPAGMACDVDWRSWQLGDSPDLHGVDAVVHAAFAHVRGRYRGGEGDDPDGFVRANRDGGLRLFDAARAAGVPVVLHLSSRAVFDGYPPGTLLTEGLAPRPTSLYGQIKTELETALATASSTRFRGISLRATGIYGDPPPGGSHKWAPVIADLAAGRAISPRVATEVHGDDLAAAVLLLLEAARGPRSRRHEGTELAPMVAHASDIVVDHRDLAREVARCLGKSDLPLPPQSDPGKLSILDCTRLRDLGWKPGGWQALQRAMPALITNALRRDRSEA